MDVFYHEFSRMWWTMKPWVGCVGGCFFDHHRVRGTGGRHGKHGTGMMEGNLVGGTLG